MQGKNKNVEVAEKLRRSPPAGGGEANLAGKYLQGSGS